MVGGAWSESRGGRTGTSGRAEVLDTIWGPDRFVRRFTSHFWLRDDGACLERAADSLHRAGADPITLGNHPHSRPSGLVQGPLDPFFELRIQPGPPQLFSFGYSTP